MPSDEDFNSNIFHPKILFHTINKKTFKIITLCSLYLIVSWKNVLSKPIQFHAINTAEPYHSGDHSDFWPNIFICIEVLQYAEKAHSQCQAVQHAGPDKVLPIQRKPQNDRGKKGKVYGDVKPIPRTAKPTPNIVPDGTMISGFNLHQKNVMETS